MAHTHTQSAPGSARSRLVPAPRTRRRRVAVAVFAMCVAVLVCVSSGAGRAAAAPGGAVDAATVVQAAVDPMPGDTAPFWVIDWGTHQGVSGHPVRSIQASAAYVGTHVVVYVQQGRTVPDAILTGLGEAFDLRIYPSLTLALGSAPDPGVDGEPRIAVVVYDFGDGAVKGYFNRNDIDATVPLGVGAPGGGGTPVFSNHREMVSINLASLLGRPENAADSAAHEFAHLLTHYHGYILGAVGSRVPQKAWIDEGIATYAEVLAGYGSYTGVPLAAFGAVPNKNVTIFSGNNWSDYGASCALIGYLTQRAQPGFLQALAAAAAEGKTGVVALQDALDDSGTFEPFAYLFDNWVAANFLTGRPAAAAPYAYQSLALDVQPDEVTGPLPAVGQATVQNYGAAYLDLPVDGSASSVRVVVDGEDHAPLRAALLSWDSGGLRAPTVTPLALSSGSLGGQATSPVGYDRHTLAVWAQGSEGADVSYGVRYSAVADPEVEVQFLDVGSNQTFSAYIQKLLVAGVVSGFESPPGSGLWYYRPEATVTRAQFAKMVVEAVGLHTPAVGNLVAPTFLDVQPTYTNGVPDAYPFDYVEEAAAAGIVQGYPGPLYKPADPILRIQLLRMILRSGAAVGRPFPLYEGSETVFADVQPGHEFYREVMTAYKLGITSGSIGSGGKTYFRPWDSATRGQVAKMTATLMERLGR